MDIKLSEADRERFGAPEWITFQLDRLAAIEAATIQHETGLAPGDLTKAIRYRYQVRQAGAWVDWTPLEKDPPPPAGARIVTDYDAWTAVVWVALRRAGRPVPWPEVAEFDVLGFDIRASVDEVDPGKGEVAPSTQPTTSAP